MADVHEILEDKSPLLLMTDEPTETEKDKAKAMGMAMGAKGVLLCSLWIVLVLFNALSPTIIAAADANLGICNSTMAECRPEDEFLMDSETHRRFLQDGRGHIGYGALHPDGAACGAGRGQSYGGHCSPAPSGNPPRRGCNTYDRCRVRGG